MLQLSERVRRIKPSATLSVNAKALDLRAQGISVISLAVGEPDFPTPQYICDAAKAAIDEGFTKYTAVGGMPEVRKAIADVYSGRDGVTLDATNIILTNGGKQNLHGLMQVLLNEGDEVLLPAPYWVSYPEMVTMAGGVTVTVFAGAEKNFKITVRDLERKRSRKTRMLVLNSPANPTGACYSQAEMDAIIGWAVEHDIFVISDEVYDQLLYEPAKPATAMYWFIAHPAHVAISNAFSKAYCMTGWRIGYAIAAPEIIRGMEKMQGQTTSNVCSIAQRAALAAFTGPQLAVQEMRTVFKRRRDMALEEIKTWPGVQCPVPDGAFYLLLDMNGVPGGSDDVKLCMDLLVKAHVATVPGSAFGAPGCMRISYAVADDVLKEALVRIRSVLFETM